jgi:hypothetical protein
MLTGFKNAYFFNAKTIEANTLAKIDFGTNGIMNPATAAAGARCTATSAQFLPWSSYAGKAATAMVNDGYGAPLCVLISAQNSISINGLNIYYHNVAFVSGGANNVLDAGTALDAQGNLTLGGDDIGVLFDGKSFASDEYKITAEKMRAIALALSQYYNSRYQSDPSRSSAVDYFSNGTGSADPTRWDSANAGNVIAFTTTPSPMYINGATTELAPSLSLTKDDVTDGWGNIINFDNASNAVRSPVNTDATKALPPYTAQVSTTLPGNVLFAQTVVGANN